ncbi:TonB-dependent receptor [Terriglobus aquaticus]|uniref:Carboxypeptidase regulatory-like domain-containing protein n=1 Tax=Terriglobus aquaticus TaxID=940139 RepID=A0ABW9KGA2_9BACT|nr:carboxypeptidase regulatory-like domain-containing protein [Terriglobus aquaticus]
MALTMPLYAQEYRGTLSGTVTDPSGAAVPGASVTAKSGEQTYVVKTDGSGRFVIPYAQPNTYMISVTADGFATAQFPNVTLQVSGTVDVPVKLSVSAAANEVTVSTEQFNLATTDASGGTVIDPEKVQNLPLNGRQVYQLLQLTPGVVFTQTQFGAGGFSGNRGWDTNNAYSINGQPGSTNQFLLNGGPISIQSGGPSGTWTIAPSVDAVQEVKVMTTTFDAQYGRAGGGIINTIIKNGTPHVHGTAYDFWENSAFEANTYQSNQVNEAKSFHNRHQFGGTVGGPLWRGSKAFGFFSFEGWREVLPAPVVTQVPTADMLPNGSAGGGVNLTNYLAAVGKTNGIFDPATNYCAVPSNTAGGCATYGRLQFPNNTIPASRISAIGVKVLQLFPAPNRPGYLSNYVFNGKDRYTYNMPIGRFDYDFSDRTKFYALVAFWSGQEYRNGNGFTGPAIQGNINNQRSDWTGVIDVTHAFSNSIVSDVRLSYNRYSNPSPDGAVAAGLANLSPADLGLTMPAIPTTSRSLAPEFSFGDNYNTVVGNTVGATIFETYDLGPSITQTIRNHSLHYGGEVSLYHDVTGSAGQPNGTFGFSTQFTQNNYTVGNKDGSAIASALLGLPASGSVQWQNGPYESYNYWGLFLQDNWKVSSKLAINAGIRYDEERSPRERHNRLLAGVDFDATNPLTNMITYPAGGVLPNGAHIANPIKGAVRYASDNTPAYLNNTGFWQPKLGFSFAPNNAIVFHGGYTLSKAFGIELGGASPFSQTTPYNYSVDNGRTPNTFFRNGNPFPNGAQAPAGTSNGALALTGNGLQFDAQDRKIPIVQQWTLGAQMQMPLNIVFNLDYFGAHTYHLRASKQLNGLSPADIARGQADNSYLDQQVANPFYGVLPNTTFLGQNQTVAARYLMVPYPQYGGDLYEYTNPQGYSNYNSLQVKAEKRLSGNGSRLGGVSVLASFTFSKLMSATGFLNNNANGITDPYPFYGVDSQDRPWNVSVSGLYNLPFGRGAAFLNNDNRFLDAAIGGWQFDWILSDYAGLPIAFPNGSNYNCGTYQITAAKKSYTSYLNNSNPGCFTNFSEYTAVTQAPLTTAVRTPNAPQEAFGLEKKFVITEGVRFQFKAEAFNATNTPIFGGPDTGNVNQAITPTGKGLPGAPGSYSGYGTVGSTQQNFPRQYQFSGKILF